MLINLVFLTISLVILLKLPSGLSLGVDLFLYASLVWYQFCFSKFSLANTVLLVSYAVLSFLFYILGVWDVLPITGVIVYSVFAGQYALRVILERGNLPLRLTALFYLALSLVSIAASFLLQPDPSYIYFPLLLFASGAVFRPKIEKAIENVFGVQPPIPYELNGLKVSAVQTQADLDAYNSVLNQVYQEIYRSIDLRTKRGLRLAAPLDQLSFEELISEKSLQPLRKKSSNLLLLIQTESDQVIGCLKLSFQPPLSIERELKINLDSLRRGLGQVGEIGRFSLIESHRQNPLVMDCVFRAIAHLCMDRGVLFLFCQALESSYPLYKKIGFTDLSGYQNHLDEEFGVPAFPMVIDVAKKVKHRLDQRGRGSRAQTVHTKEGSKHKLRTGTDTEEKYKRYRDRLLKTPLGPKALQSPLSASDFLKEYL